MIDTSSQLSKYLEHIFKGKDMKGKTVLDLGSGTGIVGIAAGEQVVARIVDMLRLTARLWSTQRTAVLTRF